MLTVSPEWSSEARVRNTPSEESYFSPRHHEEGGRSTDGNQYFDDQETQDWNNGAFDHEETQVLQLSPKSQQSESSKSAKSPSRSQRAQSEEGNAKESECAPLAEARSSNSQEAVASNSQKPKYSDINVNDRGGVTPDPTSAQDLEQKMMMVRSKITVNNAIGVAKDALGVASQESTSKFGGEHATLPGSSNSSSSSSSSSSGSGAPLAPKATKDSALATFFATQNSEIRMVVVEVTEPTSSQMQGRLQRFHKQARHTASTEDQAQPFMNHSTTSAAAHAISVFEEMDPKALELMGEEPWATLRPPRPCEVGVHVMALCLLQAAWRW